jgi:hypothetical protein
MFSFIAVDVSTPSDENTSPAVGLNLALSTLLSNATSERICPRFAPECNGFGKARTEHDPLSARLVLNVELSFERNESIRDRERAHIYDGNVFLVLKGAVGF